MSEERGTETPAIVIQPNAAPPAPAEPVPVAEALENVEATEGDVSSEAPPVEPSPETVPPEAPASDAIKAHTEEPGLLAADVGEAKKEGEEPKPPEEAKPAEPPPAEQVAYEFALPEGVELAAEPLEQFVGFARENNIAPEQAQKLVEMHVAGMQEYQGHLLQKQHDDFLEYRRKSKEAIMADPELGGSGFLTHVGKAVEMLNLMAKTPEEREELNRDLMNSGMTDRLSLFRGLNRLAKLFGSVQTVASGGQPPADAGRPNGAGRGRINYQHPRGTRNPNG